MSRPPLLSPAELYGTQPRPDGAARRKAFQAALRRTVFPWREQQGFTGTAATQRRVVDQAIHVLEFQPWKHGGGVAVNLGIHFRFLPLPAGAPAPEALEEPWCPLRWRLAPPGHTDAWWRHGATAQDTQHAVEHLAQHLTTLGAAWWADFGTLPGAYDAVTPQALPALQPRFFAGPPVLALSHVLAWSGRHTQARALLQHHQQDLAANPVRHPDHQARLAQHTQAILRLCGDPTP